MQSALGLSEKDDNRGKRHQLFPCLASSISLTHCLLALFPIRKLREACFTSFDNTVHSVVAAVRLSSAIHLHMPRYPAITQRVVAQNSSSPPGSLR